MFFYSTRGVKQWDPLTPVLFIAEVLSRALNAICKDSQHQGYEMQKLSANINNLLQMILLYLHQYKNTL